MWCARCYSHACTTNGHNGSSNGHGHTRSADDHAHPGSANTHPDPCTAYGHTHRRPTDTHTAEVTLATSVDDILGVWHSRAKGVYLGFYSEGIMHHASSLDRLDSAPSVVEEIEFDGTQMFVTTVSVTGVIPCGDDVGVYEVWLLPDGRLQIKIVEDVCRPRANLTASTFEPVP